MTKRKASSYKTNYWLLFYGDGGIWTHARLFEPPAGFRDQSLQPLGYISKDLSQHQYPGKWGELMGRTKKNIKLKITGKPCEIKVFRSGDYQIVIMFSSLDSSTTWVRPQRIFDWYNIQYIISGTGGKSNQFYEREKKSGVFPWHILPSPVKLDIVAQTVLFSTYWVCV